MSGINPIVTQQTAGTAQQALSGSKTGVFANMGGGNFFDLIIARLAAGIDPAISGEGAQNATASTAASTSSPMALQSENALAMLQVALAGQTLDSKGNIVLPQTGENVEKIQKQLDVTNQIINHLKNVLPENAEKEGLFSKILAKLQTRSDSLQASLSVLEGGVIAKDTPVEDLPLPILIALGLNPAEITEVTEKLQALEEKLGRDITIEDLIAGVGTLIPPATDKSVIALAGGPKTTDASSAVIDGIDENSMPTDDLAAQLNALDVGGEDLQKQPATDPALLPQKKEMKGLPVPEEAMSKDNNGLPVETRMKKQDSNIRENLVNTINPAGKAAKADMTFPTTMFGLESDAAIFQQYGIQPTAALSLGHTAQSANLIATPATAGQAHPATNMVAAHIVKFANNSTNGDQTMQIRLDPPELGNVNVRLQIGKDKAIKAHIVVEKPETYLMLQRDAHSLERAMQNAGFDTGSDSISFELAHDNGTFAQNGRGDGDMNFGGGGNGSQDADAGLEIIQSSVTWQVDPSTGHVRYNIFA